MSGVIRLLNRVWKTSLVLSGIILLIGCGGEPPSMQASGGSMSASADAEAAESSDSTGRNRAPVIQSLSLDPSEPQAGRRVRAVAAAADPDGDPVKLGYNWTINGRRVPGGGAEIVLGELDRDDVVSVRVIASDGRHQSEPVTVSARAGNRAPRILDLVIHSSGNPGEPGGEWRVEPVAEDSDGDLIEFDYTWRVGQKVVGSENTLKRHGWKRGDQIVVTVVARDRNDESAPIESAPIVIGNAAPEIVSKPPGLDASGAFNYQISAKDPDGDRGLRYSLGEAPSGMQVDPFSGLVTWQATMNHEGEHKVEVIVDDRQGASTKQIFFVAVRAKSGSSPAALR